MKVEESKCANNLSSLVDPMILENEDKLKKYVFSHNQKLSTLRTNLYKAVNQNA